MKKKCAFLSPPHGYTFSTLCLCVLSEDKADLEGDNSVKLSRAAGMRELYRACCAIIPVIIGVISDIKGEWIVRSVIFDRMKKCVFLIK